MLKSTQTPIRDSDVETDSEADKEPWCWFWLDVVDTDSEVNRHWLGTGSGRWDRPIIQRWYLTPMLTLIQMSRLIRMLTLDSDAFWGWDRLWMLKLIQCRDRFGRLINDRTDADSDVDTDSEAGPTWGRCTHLSSPEVDNDSVGRDWL